MDAFAIVRGLGRAHQKTLRASTLTLVLVWLMSISAFGAEMGPVRSFCVQTMNMYGPGYASDVWLRFRVASQYFSEDACDVLTLQEVWSEKQFKSLSQIPSQKWPQFGAKYFGRTEANPDSGRFGMATITSQEILDSEKGVFAVNYDSDATLQAPLEVIRKSLDVKKGYGIVTLNINGMYPIAFINTHLHPTSEIVRLAQTVELLDAISKYIERDIPVVLSGDLNTQPGSLELELLRAVTRVKDTMNWSDECTYCFWNPYAIKLAFNSVRMDYTLLIDSRSLVLKTQDSEISPKKYRGLTLSDHYGIKSQILIQERDVTDTHNDISDLNHAYRTVNLALDKLQTRYSEREYLIPIAILRKFRDRIRSVDQNYELVRRLLRE